MAQLFNISFLICPTPKWSTSENSKENKGRKATERWETFWWFSCQFYWYKYISGCNYLCIQFLLILKIKDFQFGQKSHLYTLNNLPDKDNLKGNGYKIRNLLTWNYNFKVITVGLGVAPKPAKDICWNYLV